MCRMITATLTKFHCLEVLIKRSFDRKASARSTENGSLDAPLKIDTLWIDLYSDLLRKKKDLYSDFIVAEFSFLDTQSRVWVSDTRNLYTANSFS